MKKALFNPFDLKKWFIVGFTAFLAGLAEGPHGNGSQIRGDGDLSFRNIANFPSNAWEWLMNNPGWFMAIMFIGMFVIILVILVIWLSSRGKFMFLDNVVHDRAEISKPWKHFKMQGNSLFLWRLCFALICLMLFIMILFFFFTMASNIYHDSLSPLPVLLIVGMVLLGILMGVVIGYISLFLNNFVVPIMYKNNITAIQAWNQFLPLFRQYPLPFILYGLFVFILTILVVICVAIAGLLTCCIGFLLLAIPYVGSVITLPISYTYRAFSLEFLAQFGPEFVLFPPPKDSPVSAPAQK